MAISYSSKVRASLPLLVSGRVGRRSGATRAALGASVAYEGNGLDTRLAFLAREVRGREHLPRYFLPLTALYSGMVPPIVALGFSSAHLAVSAYESGRWIASGIRGLTDEMQDLPSGEIASRLEGTLERGEFKLARAMVSAIRGAGDGKYEAVMKDLSERDGSDKAPLVGSGLKAVATRYRSLASNQKNYATALLVWGASILLLALLPLGIAVHNTYRNRKEINQRIREAALNAMSVEDPLLAEQLSKLRRTGRYEGKAVTRFLNKLALIDPIRVAALREQMGE